MIITETSYHIKAPDERAVLDYEQIQTNTLETFSNAVKVARSLRIAVKNMCPSCVELVQKALSEEEQETPNK